MGGGSVCGHARLCLKWACAGISSRLSAGPTGVGKCKQELYVIVLKGSSIGVGSKMNVILCEVRQQLRKP